MKTRVMPLFSLALIVVALVFLGAGFFGGERTCYTQVDNSKVEQIEPDKGIIKLNGVRYGTRAYRRALPQAARATDPGRDQLARGSFRRASACCPGSL